MDHKKVAGTRYSLEVQPQIPERLERLTTLANDLYYSWDRHVRGLFFRLDRELWEDCGHHPKVFLRRVAQERLEKAASDRAFMEEYNRTLANYDTYYQEHSPPGLESLIDPDQDLVAYFCAEFGLHESLPIYSGGLGILAGDHCKAASDLALPFVAVGILYRQGYFTQSIDQSGHQLAHYTPHELADLPVTPATDANGREVHITVEIPGRSVALKVWRVKCGRINIYLLDTDLPGNSDADRAITYQLYGGDDDTRIQQEIVLGVGGVRALRALDLSPTVWHINEGHSALQILERCHEYVRQGIDFATSMELVAASTVFTTHTPVPAGHDVFDRDMVRYYFSDYLKEFRINEEDFLKLGDNSDKHGFNMTSLAFRGSRRHNGVSRIHGDVASKVDSHMWPEVPPNENPIGHVTNGVHLPTFLAREWINLFDMQLDSEWRNMLLNEQFWERIDDIPDTSYWSVRLTLKSHLIDEIRRRIRRRAVRHEFGEAHVNRLTRILDEHDDLLLLGFARRFAAYKRAALLFSDADRLARLLNQCERPVVLVFAGKAHPNDAPGQELI
ncbi:MAG: alpha-glucan family phosphorylase, partial [Gammaproteobacteria bacterium]|nr:alpha-glucan family phosphorylase [Gammaproteobacteria bacterium]